MELNKVIYPAPEPSCNILKYTRSNNKEMREKLLLVPAYEVQLENFGYLPENFEPCRLDFII